MLVSQGKSTLALKPKPVVRDVRMQDDEFATLYLSHKDEEVRYNAVRQLRFVKPPLSVQEIKEHDGGQTFERLLTLSITTDEAERHPMGTAGRTRKMAMELVEMVLASDLKPGVGEGYKAHIAAVQRGPGGSMWKGMKEDEPVQRERTVGEPIADFTRREASIALGESRQRERDTREADNTQQWARRGPLTGHTYGICSACKVRVRLNDDNTSRKHAAGKHSIRRDDVPCAGSNELVCKLIENDIVYSGKGPRRKRTWVEAIARARAEAEGETKAEAKEQDMMRNKWCGQSDNDSDNDLDHVSDNNSDDD